MFHHVGELFCIIPTILRELPFQIKPGRCLKNPSNVTPFMGEVLEILLRQQSLCSHADGLHRNLM